MNINCLAICVCVFVLDWIVMIKMTILMNFYWFACMATEIKLITTQNTWNIHFWVSDNKIEYIVHVLLHFVQTHLWIADSLNSANICQKSISWYYFLVYQKLHIFNAFISLYPLWSLDLHSVHRYKAIIYIDVTFGIEIRNFLTSNLSIYYFYFSDYCKYFINIMKMWKIIRSIQFRFVWRWSEWHLWY